MTEQDRISTTDDSEKDEYPPDTEFGRSAAEDHEKADELEREGLDPDEASEESFPASDPPSSTGSGL